MKLRGVLDKQWTLEVWFFYVSLRIKVRLENVFIFKAYAVSEKSSRAFHNLIFIRRAYKIPP